MLYKPRAYKPDFAIRVLLEGRRAEKTLWVGSRTVPCFKILISLYIKMFSWNLGISGDASDLLRLSSELVDILQKDHEFEMTIGQLQVRYFSTFDKPLDASSYGFHSVYDLLLALPAVAEV